MPTFIGMKILYLLQPGTNSRSIFLDMIAGTRTAGHEAVILELDPLWTATSRMPQQRNAVQGDFCRLIATFIQHNGIDLTVGMWANGLTTLGLINHEGRLATIFDAIQHPHLMIWLDSPERANDGSVAPLFSTGVLQSPHLYHFINNTGTAAEMTELFNFNPRTVLPSRYGINPDLFRPDPNVPRRYDLMFSAGGGDRWTAPTPLMRDEVGKDEPDVDAVRRELAKQVEPKLDALSQSFDAAIRPGVRKVMSELLTMQIEQRDVTMTQRLSLIGRDAELKPAVAAFTKQINVYVQALQAIRSIEHFIRAFTFVHLAKHFNCAMFGTADFSAWGCDVKSAGFVPYEKQAAMYSQASVGLSVMRWQDEVGVHIKPMEIAASGVACLAHHRCGIEDLYVPGREIVTYHTLAEARNRLAALLADPTGLASIAEAGYQRTLVDHTWATVVSELVEKIEAHRSGADDTARQTKAA
ncbi:MAG: glycosyltransferase [Planctomycetes bacterium]|nr:glycosyltransferase [Planctomycetota bacterium]